MTANLPVEVARALGLSAEGDEAYITVTAVNSDGSVVVQSEMDEEDDDMEETAEPAPSPSMPAALSSMLGA